MCRLQHLRYHLARAVCLQLERYATGAVLDWRSDTTRYDHSHSLIHSLALAECSEQEREFHTAVKISSGSNLTYDISILIRITYFLMYFDNLINYLSRHVTAFVRLFVPLFVRSFVQFTRHGLVIFCPWTFYPCTA